MRLQRCEGNASDAAKLKDMVHPQNANLNSEQLIEMVKRRSAHDNKTNQKRATDYCQAIRQRRTPDQAPGQGHASSARYGDHDNKEPLDDSPLFIPSRRFGKIFCDESEPCLQIKLLIEAKDKEAQCKHNPENSFHSR